MRQEPYSSRAVKLPIALLASSIRKIKAEKLKIAKKGRKMK